VPHRTLHVDLAVPSFLTDGSTTSLKGLPPTFVPGRNLVFLAHAYAIAGAIGAEHIVFGANALDYSGYPDCRPAFAGAMALAGNTALGHSRIVLEAPLIDSTKAEIAKLGFSLGDRCRAALALSWSCYDPQQTETSAEPCGVCAACVFRAKGFAEAGLPDPARRTEEP
jgi:7-cyano-7-deazaguanine synthase